MAKKKSKRLPDPAVTPTITVDEAGRLLGISRSSAYNAAHNGDIKCIRIGRRLLVPTAWLVAQLQGGDA